MENPITTFKGKETNGKQNKTEADEKLYFV